VSTAAAFLLAAAALQPGAVTSLNGTWNYQPASAGPAFAVPVPQMLNRIQWWLDDSDDYRAWENARLAKLGFDTDRDEEGTYALQLTVPALPKGRHLFVEFDGVAMLSKVWLNGQLLGGHTGMFSRFGYDLTPHLKAGANELKVWVSMEKLTVSSHAMSEAVTVNLTASKVVTLSKGMFGPLAPGRPNREYDMHGIWQPVRLVARDAAMLDDAWFIPALTGAEVRVEAHALDPGVRMQARARWVDGAGRVFATAPPVPIEKSATLRISNVQPALWTPADPRLYRMEVRLETPDGRLLDRIERHVGFRTFEARGNQLYLNGHRYWLRGANQLPYGKNPWDPRLARRLIQSMHDNNLRVTRTHATPWNEAWLDAADEIGLGVSIEGIRPWALAGLIGMPPKPIAESWLAENADVVRRIRNHPSVLIWTVGNEMLLRDARNLDKWKLLSDVVKQTRQLDPYRPVVASSEYTRDPEVYARDLAPNGIDDGDLDDIHRYRGWYTESPFVTDSLFATEMRRNRGQRPFIGQEMSSGYPDLDTGLPVRHYAVDLVTPQAWVGEDGLPGHDPAVYLEHHRAVTKRWAEQLRFQRGDRTAGFLMFSVECWFRHSFDPETASPYPVVASMREAWAPVGLALETGRRRFFTGEKLETAVFVTNDDEQFRDLTDLTLEVIAGAAPTRIKIAKLPYFATGRVPVSLPVTGSKIELRLLSGGREIARSSDPVQVFPQAPVPDLSSFVRDLKSDWRERAEHGETVVLLNPGKALVDLFPDDVESFRATVGEYADWSPAAGTPLTAGLGKMDLKWWGRRDDWRVFVTSGAHRLRKGGKARELVRFVPAHSYIAPERVPEQYQSVVFDIPVGKGIVRVVDLDLDASVPVDPAARLFATRLAAR
jgi:beta-galactosidase